MDASNRRWRSVVILFAAVVTLGLVATGVVSAALAVAERHAQGGVAESASAEAAAPGAGASTGSAAGAAPAAGAAAMASAAQIPDTFTNLQVFPADIERNELVAAMRGFTAALDVRCEYCHVGEGNDLSAFDFASDDKEHKRVARVMLRMVQEINETYGEELGEHDHHGEALVEVRCVTCHRGATKPRMLADVLDEVMAAEGVEAAIAHYRELREQYYGGFTYDFSEPSLRQYGQRLTERGQTAEAVAILELNAELYPGSAQNYVALSQAHQAGGDLQSALEAIERGLQAQPDNQLLQRRLQQLRRLIR